MAKFYVMKSKVTKKGETSTWQNIWPLVQANAKFLQNISHKNCSFGRVWNIQCYF